MSRVEFLAWVRYYEMAPFDDFHRFHRPAALVAQSLGGGDVSKHLDWLQPPPAQPGDEHLTEADISTLRALGLRK